MRLSPRNDCGIIKTDGSPFGRMHSVGLHAVRWSRGFWGERFRQCRETTLPRLWDLLSDPARGHALTNLRIAAGLEEGEFAGAHWQDEWVYKWIEAAASISAATGDRALGARMDEVIDVIARAQQPDGYLATQTIVRGWPRFRDARHHELHVMGHLVTAACIHHRATGKTSFLDVARRAADLIHATFRERGQALARFAPDPTLIMAGVELYRTTGERRYLDVADLFIDGCGTAPGGSGRPRGFAFAHEEEEVAGQMVTAAYLGAGAADAYLERGDPALLRSLERSWDDLEGKLSLEGGCCAVRRALSPRRPGDGRWPEETREAAGPAYDITSATADGETCAQIGHLMWSWRMLTITGDARYADAMERALYNPILSGIGLDGASWFCTNPRRRHGAEHVLLSQDVRQRFEPGRDHGCGPSNLLRLVAEWHGYLYSASDEGLWVHHYGANNFEGILPDGTPLRLRQETKYPWEGEVELTIDMPKPSDFALMLRIPGWVEEAHLLINDRARDIPLEPGTYARIKRTWLPGDQVVLVLPMVPRLVEAPPRAEQLRGRVAVTRGPLAYCLESPDLPEGIPVSEVSVCEGVHWTPRHRCDFLGGVVALEGDALRAPASGPGGRQDWPRPRDGGKLRVRLIPYYAWANRGPSEMTVWMPLAGE